MLVDVDVADTAARVALGAETSMMTESVLDVVETFPDPSVCVADTLQVPLVRLPNWHVPPDVLPTMVQVTSLEPVLDAVTVTVPPFSAAVTEKVGDDTDVTLSVFELPASDPSTRSGVPGCEGGVESEPGPGPGLCASVM